MKRKSEIQRWELNGSANYGGAATLTINATPEALMEIRQFMESNEPAGIPGSIQQQADAWVAVCSALSAAAPGWQQNNDHDGAKNRAVAAIKAMGEPKAKPKPLAFDLEAAKAGAAVKWLGVAVRWIGLSDKHKDCTNIVEHDGGLSYVSDKELRMAPKPKRRVWVNLYQGAFNEWRTYNTAEDAGAAASRDNLPIIARAIAVAVPIEIDA